MQYPFRVFTRLILEPGTPALAEMTRRGNVHGSIHDLPTYTFTHPEVAHLHTFIDQMRMRLGAAGIYKGLHLATSILHTCGADGQDGEPRGMASHTRLLSLQLRRLPYTMFADLLRMARNGSLTHTAFEQCLVPAETLLTRAVQTLAEYRRQLDGQTPNAFTAPTDIEAEPTDSLEVPR